MRAIDLYSGIGGWSLGLRLADIEVVASFEWWDVANRTRGGNLGSKENQVNIRRLTLDDLPKDIDVVVGSPPCTQFSYSNRGGSGDIDDGLKDIAKFLEIVNFINPDYWAMENVPRVATLLQDHLFGPEGHLNEYAHLFGDGGAEIHVIDMSRFGLPQRRRRCIAGHLPFGLLEGYAGRCLSRSLGEVLNSLSNDPATDCIYGLEIAGDYVFDNDLEEPLSDEERRMNKDAKNFHPIYNNMSFPDRTDQAVRTITATCTRVSRESVVIDNPLNPGNYRRLTVRERALLQGFPITFQFFGKTYSEKLKMVGNAIPPLITYYIGCAFRSIRPGELKHPHELDWDLPAPDERPNETPPSSVGRKYPLRRRFRAAIPNLRFMSGLRFEMVNSFEADGKVRWSVDFYYGDSKRIRNIPLDEQLNQTIKNLPVFAKMADTFEMEFGSLTDHIGGVAAECIQDVWTHKVDGIGPYEIVDTLGVIAKRLIPMIPKEYAGEIRDFVDLMTEDKQPEVNEDGVEKRLSNEKPKKYAIQILVGLLIGSQFNDYCDISSNARAKAEAA